MALFLTPQEIALNTSHYSSYERAHVKRIKKEERPSLIPDKIGEPYPCESHIYCSVCRTKFAAYFEHVNSEHH